LERRALETGGGVELQPSIVVRPGAGRDGAPLPAGPYRALREKLLARTNGRPIKTLVFAGCRGGEGGSRVAREFAESLVSSGLAVLLVEADVHAAGLAIGTTPRETDRTPGASGSAPKGRLAIVRSPAVEKTKERIFRAPELAEWLGSQAAAYDYVV